MKSRLNKIAPYLVIALTHLVSSLPGLSSIYLAFSLVGLIFWTIRKKDELVLLLLLLGSSFSYSSLNIWNNGVVPVLPFLLLTLALLLDPVRITIRYVLIFALCAVGFFAYSMGNILEVGISPIIIDLLVVSSIPLAALRFRNLSEHKFFLAFSACALITIARMVAVAYLDFENPVLSTYNDLKFLDTLDELIGFYFLVILLLISTSNRLRWVAISLFAAIIFHYVSSDVSLGYYSIGTQILLMLVFFIICILARLSIALVIIVGIMVLISPSMGTLLDLQVDLKIQQLKSLFDMLDVGNSALLPHSVHVRLAELKEFSDAGWAQQLFGGGLGGYINISNYFPSILSPDDYSEQQITSGRIITPHNLGYLIIKFGYAGIVLALLFLMRIYRITWGMPVIKFAFYMTFGAFLILNIGYTLKISFLLGVLWAVIGNCYKFKRVVGESQSVIDENISRRSIYE